MQEHIDRIRAAYTKDFNSKDSVKRQVAVATYLIDKLALRAGNEKVQGLHMIVLLLLILILFLKLYTQNFEMHTHTQP